MEDVKLIAIPFYDSLSIRRNWKDIQQLYPDILHYFPNYDPEYIPSRKYFWEIFASLHHEDAKKIIHNERKRKFEKEASEKTKEIVINKDILDLIQGSLYFSKKKGRALYNFKPKEFGQPVNRKRKISELDGFVGDRLSVSVFNKNREQRRSKLIDTNVIGSQIITKDQRERQLINSNPFKKQLKNTLQTRF